MGVLVDTADAIADKLAALNIKTYRWAPRDLDAIPAGVIELPSIDRGGPDTTENAPLGLNGWLLDFPVTLYFELTEPEVTQDLAAETVEAFITAVDDDPGLGGMALDSAVTRSEPVVIDDRTRVLLAYECRVEALIQVVDNDP